VLTKITVKANNHSVDHSWIIQ